jgi:hypothetical protein
MKRTTTDRRIVKRFVRHERGMAMVEFAMVLPLLLTLFYGAVEITRYVLIVQKAEKFSHTVADVSAQSQTVTTASLNQLLTASSDLMRPFSMNENGRVIITSLYREPGQANARVNWRHQGGGSLTAISRLGAMGAVPSMPVVFAFDERENLIAAEVYYRFSPLISDQFFGTTTVYRVAFYKPRLGALVSPPT